MVRQPYQPYDGPVVDLDKKHFHRWHLGEKAYTGIDGKPWNTLAYVPAIRPYKDRQTARNHGAQFGGTQMVLQCDGGEGCPLRFDPFKGVTDGS